jgi:hypothetical protein
MALMSLDPTDYTKASALVVHATLVKSIEASYPHLTIAVQNAMLIDILDQVARVHGWRLRREATMEDIDGE